MQGGEVTARVPVMERFWSKVRKHEGPAGCWLWMGPIDEKGYGLITVDNRTRKAHAIAYIDAHGPVPHGLELDYLLLLSVVAAASTWTLLGTMETWSR